MSTSQYTPKDIQRFWSKVDSSGGVDSCWNWQRRLDHGGYGKFSIGTKSITAHKFAWVITNGEIKNKLFVLHICDNPACCNPKHLFLGTNSDNMRDKVAKGRQLKGEQINTAKLTVEQVRIIRSQYAAGKISKQKLADSWGVTQANIHAIISGKTWRE